MTTTTIEAGYEVAPNPGLKMVYFVTPSTADPGDTLAITLATYGITKVLAVYSFVHTTDYSVIVPVANTTAVSAGTLTVTLVAGDGNTDKRRVIKVVGSN
jgi:hypothetical protein